ncbi:MAG: hypothetical protein JWM93_3571, partial [Frankiales bacterium]|nr:hypothetical protein [Frankiales bacterium]
MNGAVVGCAALSGAAAALALPA